MTAELSLIRSFVHIFEPLPWHPTPSQHHIITALLGVSLALKKSSMTGIWPIKPNSENRSANLGSSDEVSEEGEGELEGTWLMFPSFCSGLHRQEVLPVRACQEFTRGRCNIVFSFQPGNVLTGIPTLVPKLVGKVGGRDGDSELVLVHVVPVLLLVVWEVSLIVFGLLVALLLGSGAVAGFSIDTVAGVEETGV